MIVTNNDFTGSNGETVEAVITVESADNVGSMDLTFGYDPQILFFEDVLKGSLTEDSIVEFNPNDGFIRILINDVNGFSGSGSILRILFMVNGTSGESCDLVLMDMEANDASSYVDKLIESVPGVFHVEDSVPRSITCEVSPSKVTVDESVLLSGEIIPALDGVGITLTLTNPNGAKSEVITSSDENGVYSGTYSPDIEGNWNVEASWTDSLTTITSSSKGITVEPNLSGGIPGYTAGSVIVGLVLSAILKTRQASSARIKNIHHHFML